MQRRSLLRIAGPLLPARGLWGLTPASQHPPPGREGHGVLNQKIVFAVENDGRIGYQSFVRDDKGAWAAGSLPSNPLD